MKRALKISGIVLGALIGLVLLLILLLPLVFDPNQFKPQIIEAVKQHTGRELKIDGNIGWSVFPRIGIKTGRMQLSNAPGFGAEPMAKLEAATVQVELLPLLSKHVIVDTLTIDGLQLNLAKNAAGHSNWEDLLQTHAATKPAEPAPAPTTPGGTPSLASFAAGKLAIRHASFTWTDQASGTHYAARDLTLTTGRLALDQPMSLHLDVTLEYGAPAKQLPLSLQTTATLRTDKLALSALELRLDDSRLRGTLEIDHFAKPAYRFDLALDNFDLDKYVGPAPKAAATTQASTTSTPAPAKAVEIPLPLLRALEADGKLHVDTLKAFGIRSSDVVIQVAAHHGSLSFGPNSAKLYGGSYTGHTVLDVNGKTPRLGFDERLEKVQLGPFLTDAGVYAHFSGEARIALKLAGQGLDAAQLKRTLNGSVGIAIADGTIDGIDLEKAEAQIKQARQKHGDNLSQLLQAVPELIPQKGDQTKFSKLGATATISQGIVSNNDLAIEAPHVKVGGAGKLNLVADTYDNYTLRVGDVPLILSGSLSAVPKIRPDWNAIAKNAVKKEVEKKKGKIEEKAKQKLKDLWKK